MSITPLFVKRSVPWCDRDLSLETGRLARQADSSVLSSYGNTSVLCTISIGEEDTCSFLPLTVNFVARAYSFGKIPGGFFKREGKPSESEVLISRMIDRAIRPSLNASFGKQIYLTCMMLSHDIDSPPEISAIIGSSAACSFIPGLDSTAIGAIKVALDGEYLEINPGANVSKNCSVDLLMAGSKDGIVMMDSSSDSISEENLVGIMKEAKREMTDVLSFINEFTSIASLAGTKEKVTKTNAVRMPVKIKKLRTEVEKLIKSNIFQILEQENKKDTNILLKDLIQKVIETTSSEMSEEEARQLFEVLSKQIVRDRIISEGKRGDGRTCEEIRKISIETGILQGTHGSALFTRGNTQVLATTTLGGSSDEQIVDDMGAGSENRESFMLHYNFPPFSVGDPAAIRFSPGRREIGHGRLARKAFLRSLPDKKVFPYTIRSVSEVTESDGSSSMATICGCSLAMVDAGVPLSKHIAGIAMGLIYSGKDYAILSDISGFEDGCGDMDLKVAASENGICALQMDVKTSSIPFEIVLSALKQAVKGCNSILEKMNSSVLPGNKSVSGRTVPSMEIMVINKDKIRDLIGTGGKTIKKICEESGARIDVATDGKVSISSASNDSIKKAKLLIQDAIKDPNLNETYECSIIKKIGSGFLVSFAGNKQGLILYEKYFGSGEIGSKIGAVLIENKDGKYRLECRQVESEDKQVLSFVEEHTSIDEEVIEFNEKENASAKVDSLRRNIPTPRSAFRKKR